MTHHKPYHRDFAETKVGRSRKFARRLARAAKEQWLYESAGAR